jgi:hypothetical protein
MILMLLCTRNVPQRGVFVDFSLFAVLWNQ